jgi:hypothetical protein
VEIKSITIGNNDFYLVEAQTKLSAKQAKIIRYGMKGDAAILIKTSKLICPNFRVQINALSYFINQLFRKN